MPKLAFRCSPASSPIASPPCPRHPSKLLPQVNTAPFSVTAIECRGPAAILTTFPASLPPGALCERLSSQAGAVIALVSDRAPPDNGTPHCPSSFRPNDHTSPSRVRHIVWKCPHCTSITGSYSFGSPSTFRACVKWETAVATPSCPKSFSPHVYTAPSVPTIAVCAPPEETAIAPTGKAIFLNKSVLKPSALSPTPVEPCPRRPKSPLPHENANDA
mmetsp:Transcript_6021/g.22763  ORF Transcript_6021/g.22763 Transcript_6021/m.22763 type:complete len:217 (-) Transcript_6021:143-793(-)